MSNLVLESIKQQCEDKSQSELNRNHHNGIENHASHAFEENRIREYTLVVSKPGKTFSKYLGIGEQGYVESVYEGNNKENNEYQAEGSSEEPSP